MDHAAFDFLTRSWACAPSRRSALHFIAGSVLGAWTGLPNLTGSVAKKKKKKKVTLCLNGQTIQASKKKKKKLLKSGATPGACSPPPPPPICTPTCPGTTCGSDDGCGGTCGCATGFVCDSGICHACSFTCGGNSAACGAALQIALNGGGTIYICPGRYAGTFTLGAPNVILIGAGQGDDPANNTILDAEGSGRVVHVSVNVTATLQGLRITGGNTPALNEGGGIRNEGTLTVTACTITGNRSANGGAGVHNFQGGTGPLTLNACTVSGNTSLGFGGGVHNSGGKIANINGTAISGNMAKSGGGVFTQGTVIFNSASSVTGNTATLAGSGGGIHNFVGGTVALNGADVSGNTPLNCVNVPGCVG